MKRSVGAGFCATLLLLLCVLVEGVGAYDTSAVRNQERSHDNYDGTATKTVKMTRENGKQRENNVPRDSSNQWEHTRSGEKRASPKIQETTDTTTTTTATRTKEQRSDRNRYDGRTPGNGVAVDDRNERTNQRDYGVGGSTERTNSGPAHPPPSRNSNVDQREEGRTRTRDGTTRNGHDGKDTTSDSRTQQTNEEPKDRHSSNGEANVRERPAPKTPSDRPPSEERTRGEEQEPVVQAKTEAHPIGLINALNGKVARARSIDLEPREMDTTTIIIASALGGFAILIFILFCVAQIAKKRREKKADSTRLLRVFQYLHELNVDDIDIQLSAAGGFHVGYLNGLAQGINTKKQSDQKTDTSSDEGENGSVLSKKV